MVVFLWLCFCGGVFVVVWWCLCGCVFAFLRLCFVFLCFCGGVFVVVFLCWWGGVFVVVWLCFCAVPVSRQCEVTRFLWCAASLDEPETIFR